MKFKRFLLVTLLFVICITSISYADTDSEYYIVLKTNGTAPHWYVANIQQDKNSILYGTCGHTKVIISASTCEDSIQVKAGNETVKLLLGNSINSFIYRDYTVYVVRKEMLPENIKDSGEYENTVFVGIDEESYKENTHRNIMRMLCTKYYSNMPVRNKSLGGTFTDWFVHEIFRDKDIAENNIEALRKASKGKNYIDPTWENICCEALYSMLSDNHITPQDATIVSADIGANKGSASLVEQVKYVWESDNFTSEQKLMWLAQVLNIEGSGGNTQMDNAQDAATLKPATGDSNEEVDGISIKDWRDWYTAAYKIAAGISPQSEGWGLSEKYTTLATLYHTLSDTEHEDAYKRVFDIASLASSGSNSELANRWIITSDGINILEWAYGKINNKSSSPGPNAIQVHEEAMSKLSSLSMTFDDRIKQAASFRSRMVELYYTATQQISSDETLISSYYENGSNQRIPSTVLDKIADESFNALSFDGTIYKGLPLSGNGADGKEKYMTYMLQTIWEVPTLRQYYGEELVESLKNGTAAERKDAITALTEMKKTVDEFGIPILTFLWEESDSTLTSSYGEGFDSLKKIYEAVLRDKSVQAAGIDDTPKVLSSGKPLEMFFADYSDNGSEGALSDYYTMGIAYTATLIPMKDNVFSKSWLSYLSPEFKDEFYTLWGYNRKALFVDSSSGAGEAYFTSGRTYRGPIRVCTLRDILEMKDDLVLYLDDNFYNVKELQESMDRCPTYIKAEESDSDWWQNLAKDVETVYNTIFDSIMKIGENTNYSKSFYDMMSMVTDAHKYFPEATTDNPGNSDNIVMSSGKINYYLKKDEVGSEIYSPLQGYAVVSSVYRDGELFTLANSQYVQQPVFIASKSAPYVANAPIEQMQTIFNYALVKNLKEAMPIDYAGNLDMDCPVYMDILGNVVTESGTVVIPAASNATIMSHSNYYQSMFSAGLFNVYGLDYRIPVDKVAKNAQLKSVVEEFFTPDESGKYYVPQAMAVGEDLYQIDMSRLSASSKDTLDKLYTTMYNELRRTASGGSQLYDFHSYVQIALEVMRGAPIESIDKEAEGLSTDDRLDRAGIVAAAKLEDLNESLQTNGDNTVLYMPNIAFMPGLNYVILFGFKILLLAVIVVNMVTVYLDAVSESLHLYTFWKCLVAFVLTMLTVVTIPLIFQITYYESNKALLQDETAYISMLNLEKSESGVEIGVTEVREPEISTELYLKLEDIKVPWYELFYNAIYTNVYQSLNDLYSNYASTRYPAVASEDDVSVKNDGVYMNVNDIYASSSVDLKMYKDDKNRYDLVQTTNDKTSTFSFYSPYYAILDALIRNVNYYNANPRGEEESNIEGWYSYSVKNQKGGRLKTVGLCEAYFTSDQFMEVDGKDLLGLKVIYSQLFDDTFADDPATMNLYSENNLESMCKAYWYPEGISSMECKKRIEWLNNEARDFVVKNRSMLGKISDETFLKVMALSLAVKHNRIFGATRASAFEIYNLSSDDLIRLSVAKRSDVMMCSTLSYPRFVYAVGGTPAVYAAALLSMVMWISSIVKPILLIVAFVTIFVSVFVFHVCLRKENSSVFGYIITGMLLCVTNILYSVLLKLSMFLPQMNLTPFMCILVQLMIQIAYMVLLLKVVLTAFREWSDLGFTKYASKFQDLKVGVFSKLHSKRDTNSENPFYGGTTMQSDPERNWKYYDDMISERKDRSR